MVRSEDMKMVLSFDRRHAGAVIILLLGVLTLQVAAAGGASGTEAWRIVSLDDGDSRIEASFRTFVEKYARPYAADAAELHRRLDVFRRNWKLAAERNNRGSEASEKRHGVTPFFDLTEEEFRATYLLDSTPAHRHGDDSLKALRFNSKAGSKSLLQLHGQAEAFKVNWIERGAVTGISDQGECHSNWAFSATAAIESRWKIAGHVLTKLSSQELVSCAGSPIGCVEKPIRAAWDYLTSAKNGSCVAETSFPYVSSKGDIPPCSSIAPNATVGAVITGWDSLTSDDENLMINVLVERGPFVITVDATTWQSYVGGIMSTDCDQGQLNHFAVVVGIDQTYEIPYWIVKNSWGVLWGEEGYARLATGYNTCLMNKAPKEVTVGKLPPPPMTTTHPATPRPEPTPEPKPRPPTPEPATPTPPTPAPLTPKPQTPFPPTPHPPTPHPPTPLPSTSAPPTHAPPTRAPARGDFTQYQCLDSMCVLCSSRTFAQGECIVGLREAVIVSCTPEKLMIEHFRDSDKCKGDHHTTTEPVEQCFLDSEGNYAFNVCGGTAASSSSSSSAPSSSST